jgi:hypothetical protein
VDGMRPQWMTPASYLLPASSFYRDGFPTPRLPAGSDVAVDCGGFVATKIWGEYRYNPDQYVEWCSRVPNLRWAAMPDKCCEQEVAGTEGLVRERQVWTRERARLFIQTYGPAPWAWVPTLQGWTVADYLRAADDLEPLIRQLQHFYFERPAHLYETTDEPDPAELAAAERNTLDFRVGIGTLCARKSTAQIVEIVEALTARLPNVDFHLWGVKLQAIKEWPGGLPASVVSTDSAAWNGRFGRDIPTLDAERAALGMSQREHGYKVQLPKYRRSFEAAVA